MKLRKSKLYAEYAVTIAARLKEIRNRHHYSQAQVAKMLNMGGFEPDSGKKAYAAYEQGRNIPPLDKLLRLCEIYNMSPNTILGYEDTARLNVLCDRYNITYETIDNYNVKLAISDNEHTIPKHIFFEIMFKAERMVNSVDTDYLQKLRESEKVLFNTFFNSEITNFNAPKYTLEMALHDLENIETEENDAIIEIDGKKISIDADVTAKRYREEITKVIERKKLFLNDPNCEVEDKEKIKEQIADLINQTNLTDEDTYKEIFKNLNLTEEQIDQLIKVYMEKLESKKGGKNQ